MKKFERKDFLKMSGGAIAGALVGTAASGAPFKGLQWLVEWTQDQYAAPQGPEKMLGAVCTSCPDRCGLSIRMIGGRAVKVETSNGGCPLGQNALQFLYYPERIVAPLKRVGTKGSTGGFSFKKVTWEEALLDIADRIDGLIRDRTGYLIAGINRDANPAAALLDRLIAASGSASALCEPTLDTLTGAALGGAIEYDFTDTDFVLSFGARMFEGWGNPSTMNRALVRWRERGAKIVQIDAVRTRTGSLATRWIPVYPDTESIVALGVANCLIKMGKTSGGVNFDAWASSIEKFTPEAVEKLTGVPARALTEIAEGFAGADHPVALGGRGARGVSSSGAELVAVYALNSLVNTRAARLMKRTGINDPGLSADTQEALKELKRPAGLDDFIKNMAFEILIVNEADPVYKSVYGAQLAEKMKKAFVVSITPLLNDTAAFADYVLPSLTLLEEATASGDTPLKPFPRSFDAGDIILNIARRTEAIEDSFPWGSCRELTDAAARKVPAGTFTFDAEALGRHYREILKKSAAESADFPCYLLPVEVPAVGDGCGMAAPYVLKTLDDSTFSDGTMWVLVNRGTGEKYGISDGGRIILKSARGDFGNLFGNVRASLTDTMAPGVVGIPLGFGHHAYTSYAEGKGFNPKEIMCDTIDPVTGTADWWLTRIRISPGTAQWRRIKFKIG